MSHWEERARQSAAMANDSLSWYAAFWLLKFYPNYQELSPFFTHEITKLKRSFDLAYPAVASKYRLRAQVARTDFTKGMMRVPGNSTQEIGTFKRDCELVGIRILQLASAPNKLWAANATMYAIRQHPSLYLRFLPKLIHMVDRRPDWRSDLEALAEVHEPLGNLLRETQST